MLAIFWRQIKDRRISILIYCLTAVIFLWMYVAIFPYIQEKSAEFNKLLEAYPKSFLDAFGLERSELFFDKLENFLSMEYFSFVWPIMAIAFLIAIGGSSIAGEIEKGTIETLLAQPISRLRLFLEKYLAGILLFVIFVLISIFATMPLAKAYNVDYQFENYLTVAILGTLFGLAVFSLATLFSAIFSEKGKAYFLTSGLLVVMYVLNIIAGLKENLENLKYFSFFYYYDSSRALVENKIDPAAFWVFLGVIIVSTILAALWFSKRDVMV